MRFSKTLLAGVAALALAACGNKEEGAAQSPSSAAAAKVGSGSPLDKPFRLKDAAEVDIDAFFALLPEGKRPTYESARFDSQLGATVLSNLRFSDADDGEALLVERAEFYGLDLDAIDRIKTATNVTSESPFETVFEKVRLLNLSAEGFDDEKGRFSVGGVELDRLAIRQGGAKSDGEGEEAARFFNAIDLSGLYFKDIAIKVSTANTPEAEMKAPDLRFVGLGGGKLQAMIANDMEYRMSYTDEAVMAMAASMGPEGSLLLNSPLKNLIAPENQRVVMKALEWRGVDLSGLMKWGLKGEEPPVSERNLINLGTMKAVDMETYIGAKRAAMVKEATVSAAEFTWLMPSKIRTDTKGATYDFTAYATEDQKEALAVLKKHGLDKVTGDGYAEWIWNPESGAADLEYVANAKGFGDMSMSFALSKLKLEDIGQANEDGEENAVGEIGAFKGFNLKLVDEKALDALFDLSALQMGGSGADLRQSAPAMIRLSGAQFAQLNPRFSDYVSAVADFVGEGGTLEIAANPAEPVSFADLKADTLNPMAMPDVLGLTVTHKAK